MATGISFEQAFAQFEADKAHFKKPAKKSLSASIQAIFDAQRKPTQAEVDKVVDGAYPKDPFSDAPDIFLKC